MNIRDAAKDELPFIRAQRVEAYTDYASALPASHWALLKQSIASDADTQPGVEVIVAEVDGQMAGSVALFPAKSDAYEGYLGESDYPEIRMLAVAPDYRGGGLAAALVSECIKRAKEQGYRSIGLHTGDFMKPAKKLYEKMGFERVPQYDFQPADDGIMVKAYRKQIDS